MRPMIMITVAAALLAGSASAAEPPALQKATAAGKERVAKLIEDAKKEGEISYWDGAIQAETNDRLTAAFRKHYSLPASFKVNYTLMTTSGLITKVEQEVEAGRVTADVVAVAAPAWAFGMVRKKAVLEYASSEYAAYAPAIQRGMGQDNYFAFNGAYFFVPMWSESHLKFKASSWNEIIGAVPVGRASVGDAGKSLPYIATFIGLEKALGPDFAAKLAQSKPAFILRSEQSMGRLATGEDLMSFTGMPTRAFQYNRAGAKLKFFIPSEGVVLLPQSMFILAKAPHPNAAKLWTDFILSEEGQRILVEDEAFVSGRSNFKSPNPDYAPSIDDLKVIDLDWSGMTPEHLQEARARWMKTFGQ
jgi:iron(III) transport system substrate-binding protein